MSSPIISLVCAMAKNRVIGQGNAMPWHLPADLQHFKAVTMDKPIVMGRKTYESIGRPLPGRRNVVISRNQNYCAEGCEVVDSIDAAMNLLSGSSEIMVIGGGYLYSQIIDLADKLYLTFIDLDVEGDTFFPEYEHLNLIETSRESYLNEGKEPYRYQFVNYTVNK